MVKQIKPKKFIAILHDALKECGSDVTFELDLDEECDSTSGSYNSGSLTIKNHGECVLSLDLEGRDVDSVKPTLLSIDNR